MPTCPALYSHELKMFGGTNRYDEPNFILHWLENPIRGAQEYLISPIREPAWCLANWEPTEAFGPESEWMPELGPYPIRGRYFPLHVFYACNLDGPQLNLNALRSMIYHFRRLREHNMTKRMLAYRDLREKAQKEQAKRIEDVKKDARPTFADSTSYRLQTNTRTAAQQRAETLEQTLKSNSGLRDVTRRRGAHIRKVSHAEHR